MKRRREEIIALRLYITSTSTDTTQVDHHRRMYTKRRQKMDNFLCFFFLRYLTLSLVIFDPSNDIYLLIH